MAAALGAAGLLAFAAPARAATGPFAWVAGNYPDIIQVLDTSSDTITTTFPAATSQFSGNPAALAFNPAGTYAYAVSQYGASTVSVISTASDTVTATIPVGNGPDAIAVNPAGTYAYVTNNTDGTVSVISTASDTVTATIPVGNGPDAIAVNPAGTAAYVVNNADGTVSVISTSSDTVTATISGLNTPGPIAFLPAAAPPAVTSVSPASGPTAGGTTVTITGTGFTGATAVDFGTTPATSFTVVSGTSITATAPAAAGVGTADVTVTTPAGTSGTSAADRYSYVYSLTGFLAPVDNPPVINMVEAGQAIPIQFQLGGNQGLNIIAAGYPTAQQVSCATGVPVNTATETDTAGNSGLQYDANTDTYTYVWKTSKASEGTCQVFTLGLTDGTFHTADFQYKN